MLLFFPRRYIDYGRETPVLQLTHGADVTVRVQTMQANARYVNRRHITRGIFTDGQGHMDCVWLNQPYIKAKLQIGQWLRLYGRVVIKPGERACLFCPVIVLEEETGLTPVYANIEGVPPRMLKQWVAALLPAADEMPDVLTPFTHEWGLYSRAEAVRAMHAPKDADDLAAAQNRLAFEELLLFMTAMGSLKAKRREGDAPALPFDDNTFWGGLSFTATAAQRRASGEILADMRQTAPMARLLQGDVGSGKTAVAAAALAACAHHGKQAAMMAPTELLARQHAVTLAKYLPHNSIVALYGAQPAAERRKALQALASCEAQIAVGTHALFQKSVIFADLGLVIADEQHRFGVQQRQALAEKGHSPHVLIMSATPIPRTLAFILYGDLELSLLDELPPGRTPIRTHVVLPHKQADMWPYIRAQVQRGRQAYVICPLVNDSPELAAASAEETFEFLAQGPLRGLQVGLLHGQLPTAQKQAAMQQFNAGNTDVLVATTVIEVGIDVPNASIIVILDADRFGLSQLHQLRGRVGRGAHESFCLLCTARAAGSKRLSLMASTTDGFELAEADLAMRGPGDMLGTRQSGLAQGRIAGLAQEAGLLARVKKAYDGIVGREGFDRVLEYAVGYYERAWTNI